MKILVASPFDPTALDTLSEKHEVVCAFNAAEDVLQVAIRDCNALIFRSGVQITKTVLESAPNLELIIRAGSGMDNIDLDYVERHHLPLSRIPEPGARAVAEMTFGLMLALARHIPVGNRLLSEGHWAKHELNGSLLRGKTLGIVGAGNIGSCVGRLGVAWDMKAIGCVERATPRIAESLARDGIELVSFDTVIANADFLTLHVPLTPATRYLISRDVLQRVKPGAYLINMARGGVVDERALLEALQDGRLRGAALDVHEREGEGKISPLAGLDNVVLTPHIGAMTVDTQREIGERVIEIIESWVQERSAVAAETT